ncbi:hypothetical protein FT663_04939 [Candidozyma haemuli var. vulneris]|uniref:Protein GLC8 n=1 Tax=Candidozyma haemuli TaxID=45357 RepID=A0A2V1B1V9_9ASCO|nr:hypothetical protein CXQ85_003035 [[Candida] haemuloni]KAF3986324.1 hypothetical protein FT663_04939 [[Candida] haemuloni var. vulneris]KAF3986986.1 hypothetical protein FT662_04265 [[Candida] haemuloni var. vulneris]PVH23301.1 hypothetical protein CXQ85_003035 [[Candida] haemuloni]
MSEPRGILRNKAEARRSSSNGEGDLDRSEVIRNTRLNAQLNAESSKGERIRAKIAEAKGSNGDEKTPEHLKWDEINLYKTEQEKAATMKIDEPKTPYEGGFNPEGEYYQNDDDEEEEIPDFSLGEGQFDGETKPEEDDRIIRDEGAIEDDEDDAEEEEEPLTAEERHKKFEEMRKAHYHLAANPLKHRIDVSDDDDDESGKN